jgi:hypothetical protein
MLPLRVVNLRGLPFKDLELEPLSKSDPIIPASKLAITTELELQRVRDFDSAAADEARHRGPFIDYKGTKTRTTTLTRVPFTD